MNNPTSRAGCARAGQPFDTSTAALAHAPDNRRAAAGESPLEDCVAELVAVIELVIELVAVIELVVELVAVIEGVTDAVALLLAVEVLVALLVPECDDVAVADPDAVRDGVRGTAAMELRMSARSMEATEVHTSAMC